MGILGETLEAVQDKKDLAQSEVDALVATTSERALAERNDLIDEAISRIGELDEAFYNGETDVALYHHFGRDAFDDETVKPYLKLEAEIAEQGKDGVVPVLFLDHTRESKNLEGVLVFVDPSFPILQSERKVEEDQRVNIMASRTHDVVTKYLILVGSRGSRDITVSSQGISLGYTRGEIPNGYLLRKTVFSSIGAGRSMPSDYSFTPYTVENLIESHEYGWRSPDTHRTPEAIVGAVPVEAKLIWFLSQNGVPNPSQVVALGNAFGSADGILERMPSLAALVKSAKDFVDTAKHSD